ncbi:MAG TPA: hypothetical protein DF715_05195 [Oceanicaulis sp.]|nr:hypothetical protein [Oceanicaulis sp.]
MNEFLLSASNVGKLYARNSNASRARLGAAVVNALLGRRPAAVSCDRPGEFWAVKEVSFSLKCGEALGIIGLNGSGKTTLLRVLAGQIVPDTGMIDVFGSSAAMIDLTAGFNMTQSGRENIFLRSAALGRSREQTQANLEEIIAFSELEEFIDSPVSGYSSGMLMRLAFSIMVSATPDLLFIDEILAVGDFTFRQKCLGRLREMRKRSAFVMVSHSMGDVRTFCSSVIVMHKGRVVFHGDTESAIEIYENLQYIEATSKPENKSVILAPQFNNTNALTDVRHFWCDERGKEISVIDAGEAIYFYVSFIPMIEIHRLTLGIPVWTEDGVYVTGFSTELGSNSYNAAPRVPMTFRLKVQTLIFNEGNYISNLGIMAGPEFLYRAENPVLEVRRQHPLSWGVVTLPHEWERIS